MNDGSEFLIFVALAAMAAMSVYWHSIRSRTVLETWADENGFEILHREYCHFMRGPFSWTTSKSQAVYHVTVRTRSGQVRTGWVRCGGFVLGLFSDAAEVRWED